MFPNSNICLYFAKMENYSSLLPVCVESDSLKNKSVCDVTRGTISSPRLVTRLPAAWFLYPHSHRAFVLLPNVSKARHHVGLDRQL